MDSMKPKETFNNENGFNGHEATELIFTVDKEIGSLAKAIKIFESKGVNLTHIESRPSRKNKHDYEILVTCESSNGHVADVTKVLQEKMNANVLQLSPNKTKNDAIPAFPRSIEDLDKFADKIDNYGIKGNYDYPCYTDPVYRARRQEFADIALKYKAGQPIPRVKYTKEEIETWSNMLTKLTGLFPTHACKEFNDIFPILRDECGYRVGNIPQQEDVSRFLQKRTGFRLRPVAGYLSSRDFLAGLALRVFHATQSVRHSSMPSGSPEPDICHELIGHVSMLADPSFAQFSQEIGLASLGAPDAWIDKLATCYFYTIEFGICRQDGELRAYGAAILSSFEEIQHVISGNPMVRDFDPAKTSLEPYSLENICRDVYFVAESFDDAKEKLRKFCDQIPRPFVLQYDPFTQQIEVLDNKDKLMNLASKLQGELGTLRQGIKRLCA